MAHGNTIRRVKARQGALRQNACSTLDMTGMSGDLDLIRMPAT